ncbi:hypothetical protein ACFLT9_12125 [Acidobacteriota bacterium]
MNSFVCPLCGSDNISPMEHDYKTEYPFWIVLVVVFLLIGGLVALFLFLQLHPVIMILLVVAVVSKILEMSGKSRKKAREIEYLCISCNSRFIRTESREDDPP